MTPCSDRHLECEHVHPSGEIVHVDARPARAARLPNRRVGGSGSGPSASIAGACGSGTCDTGGRGRGSAVRSDAERLLAAARAVGPPKRGMAVAEATLAHASAEAVVEACRLG
eukprot:4630415-Pleurochrysis_carterae.AAC.2